MQWERRGERKGVIRGGEGEGGRRRRGREGKDDSQSSRGREKRWVGEEGEGV